MKKSEIIEAINAQQSIILDREAKLTKKDYIGTKIAMGVAAKEDYASEIAETEEWRQDIRNANKEIERLEAIEPELEDENIEPTEE